jgi:hypothetical protein
MAALNLMNVVIATLAALLALTTVGPLAGLVVLGLALIARPADLLLGEDELEEMEDAEADLAAFEERLSA